MLNCLFPGTVVTVVLALHSFLFFPATSIYQTGDMPQRFTNGVNYFEYIIDNPLNKIIQQPIVFQLHRRDAALSHAKVG